VPLLLVVTLAEPPNVPPAPLLGTANVTVTPSTGLLLASFTVACRAVPNGVLIVALCGVPAVATTLAGELGVFVRLKLAEVLTPDTLALTV
jgi:hypothetical protein